MHIDAEKFRLPDGSLPKWVEEFDRCAPWLEAALSYGGGTHTLNDLADGVASGGFQLWAGQTAVVLTEIITYPQSRTLHYFLAGGKMPELMKMQPDIEAWARQLGCNRITLAGRRGWLRSFLKDEGYAEKWTVMAKDI